MPTPLRMLTSICRGVSDVCCSQANKELHDRVHKTELGGGAILDVGSYGVSFASWMLGPEPPTQVNAVSGSAKLQSK